MTIKQIIEDVKRITGSYSEPTFHRDRKRLKIQPLNKGQRGRQYPADAAKLIVQARGFEIALLPMRPIATAAAMVQTLPTLKELRKARTAAKGKVKR